MIPSRPRRSLLALLFILLGSASSALAARPEYDALMRMPPHVTTTHFRFFGQPDVHSTLEKLAAVAESRFEHLCRPLNACDRLNGAGGKDDPRGVPGHAAGGSTEGAGGKDDPRGVPGHAAGGSTDGAGGKIDIWVAEDAHSFAAVFPDENPMSEWAAGVAFLNARRIVLRAHGTALFSLMETFDHELAHILHHTFVRDRPLPRWYAEGLAIWQAGESVLDRLDAAVKAAASGNLLTFDELTRHFPNEGSRVTVGYAQSALFVRRLVRHHGVQPVIALLHDVSQGEDFDAAFTRRMGSPPSVLFEELSDALEKSSNPFVFLYDGNFLWGATTVLFLFVAWMKVRDRKRQLQRLAESEADRIANEDIQLFLEREQEERLARERLARERLELRRPDDDLLN